MPENADIDPILDRLRESFIETASERLDTLDSYIATLLQGSQGTTDVMTDFRGQTHSLKGTGGTFGFPLISVICHRLEEYIDDDRQYLADELEKVQDFVDQIRKIIELGINPDEAESEEILATLPIRAIAPSAPIDVRELKVVLVSPMSALRQLTGFFLSENGCQIESTDSPTDAFRLIIEGKPDLVISSIQMQAINGIDLGRAISAVSFLQNTKMCLLTSSADIGDLSDGIPEGFACVRTDQMEDDILDLVSEITAGSGS